MGEKSILKNLFILTGVLSLLVIALQNFIPEFAPYATVTWGSIVFFTLFSAVVWYFGVQASGSENKNTFLQFFMGTVMGKLFLSVFLVVAYVMIAKPASRFEVLPFIPVYIIYTIFETRFLMYLAKK